MKERWVKIIGTAIGILLFIVVVSGLTYAYYNSEVTGNISGKAACFNINYSKGSNIGSDVNPTNVILFDESEIINNNKITVKDGMAITNLSAGISSSCTNEDYYITITANVSNLNSAFRTGNSVGSFKYVIARYSSNTYSTITTTALNNISFNIVKSGSISSTGQTTLYTENLPHGSTNDYLIIFYIDGDIANDDAGSTTFAATITATATQGTAPAS